MGTDLTVDTSNTATKLFTLTKTGEAKLQNAVYAKFKGKIFRIIDCVNKGIEIIFLFLQADIDVFLRTSLLAAFLFDGISSNNYR